MFLNKENNLNRELSLTKFLIFSLLLICLAMILASGTAHAATINVNNSTPNAIGTAITTAKSGDTLKLSSGTYHEHDLVINKNLIISGPTVSSGSIPTAIIDAQKKGRIFYINSGVTVTLNNLYLKNGAATTGGGIYNHGTLIVQNSSICSNTASDYGGGIYNNFDGAVTVTGSHVNSNSGAEFGGGIYNIGTLTINKSTVNSNSADFGAGIENEGNLNIANSTMNSNQAIKSGDGGAIYNFNAGIVSVEYSTISSNSADYGGAIMNHSTLTVCGCDFKSNKATGKGNAIYNQGNFSAHFNRFYDTASGYEIYSTTTCDAKYNWWGSNSSPSSKVTSKVNKSPWIILKTSASPTVIKNGGISKIKTYLLYDSNGKYHNPTNGHLLNGMSVAFTTTKGIITSTTTLTNGVAVATLKGGKTSGVATVSSKLNNQTVKKSVTIDNTTPKITISNPTNGATKVQRNKTITINFNESIKTGNNYSKITLKSKNGTTINITKSISGKTIAIKPSTKLAASTKYTLTLYSESITDMAGNPITTKTITFTTGNT